MEGPRTRTLHHRGAPPYATLVRHVHNPVHHLYTSRVAGMGQLSATPETSPHKTSTMATSHGSLAVYWPALLTLTRFRSHGSLAFDFNLLSIPLTWFDQRHPTCRPLKPKPNFKDEYMVLCSDWKLSPVRGVLRYTSEHRLEVSADRSVTRTCLVQTCCLVAHVRATTCATTLLGWFGFEFRYSSTSIRK
jgi:hypothetical protein